MDDKVVELSKERFARSNDSEDWSVLDALEAALEYVKHNPVEGIHIMLSSENGNTEEYTTQYFSAGLNKRELVGWLMIHTIRQIE